MVNDGGLVNTVLRRNDFSIDDLKEDLRLNGQVNEVNEVEIAYLERNGEVSVVKKKGQPI